MNMEKEDLISQFQHYQQQLQTVVVQKEILKLQDMEIERTLQELNAAQTKEGYKITGFIMISKPIDELKNELIETKDAINVKMKSLEKTEQKIINKLKELEKLVKESEKK